MKYFSILFIAFLVVSCKNEVKDTSLTAEQIVDESIKVAGGDRFNTSKIVFDFRDKIYYAIRNKGNFSFGRATIEENKDTIYDLMNNDGFMRSINHIDNIFVEDSMVVKYKASINSVHYFSVLPYGLNDIAVNKTLLEEEQIKDKNYYKIKVTFNEEGGGEDYEDVFMYWFDKESFKIDYLAYSYNEDDGKGIRFREAYNERIVNGIRFVDYNNFKPKNDSIPLEDLGQSFEKNQLQLLSKIELENVTVDLINL